MIPFDIEKAKVGYQVVTRNGKMVTIIKDDMRGSDYPIIAVINCGEFDLSFSYKSNGKINGSADGDHRENDLFLLEPKAEYEAWRNEDYEIVIARNGERIATAASFEMANKIIDALRFYEDNKPQSE